VSLVEDLDRDILSAIRYERPDQSREGK